MKIGNRIRNLRELSNLAEEDVDPWITYEYLKRDLKTQFASTMELSREERDILGKEAVHKPYTLSAKKEAMEKRCDL
jgi:hypothetical protein